VSCQRGVTGFSTGKPPRARTSCPPGVAARNPACGAVLWALARKRRQEVSALSAAVRATYPLPAPERATANQPGLRPLTAGRCPAQTKAVLFGLPARLPRRRWRLPAALSCRCLCRCLWRRRSFASLSSGSGRLKRRAHYGGGGQRAGQAAQGSSVCQRSSQGFEAVEICGDAFPSLVPGRWRIVADATKAGSGSGNAPRAGRDRRAGLPKATRDARPEIGRASQLSQRAIQ
jgi:hypothetical protein